MASRPCEDTGISWRVVLLVGVAAVLAFASHLGEEPLPEASLTSSVRGPGGGSRLPALRMLPNGAEAVEASALAQPTGEEKPDGLDYDPRTWRADRTSSSRPSRARHARH